MESEYQKQNQQIRDEKTTLAERWAAYESDARTIRHQEHSLRIERQHLSEERVSDLFFIVSYLDMAIV